MFSRRVHSTGQVAQSLARVALQKLGDNIARVPITSLRMIHFHVQGARSQAGGGGVGNLTNTSTFRRVEYVHRRELSGMRTNRKTASANRAQTIAKTSFFWAPQLNIDTLAESNTFRALQNRAV